jgi:hypothetical protein
MPLTQKTCALEWTDGSTGAATFAGNNAAWLCRCGRELPLIGISRSPASEAVSVECPDCLRNYAVVGEKDRGVVTSVQELRSAASTGAAHQISPSGVKVFDDFRANLIVDEDDEVLAGMRAKKLEHLRSDNSEDALTWNVFRTLNHLPAVRWFPLLFGAAFPQQPCPAADDVRLVLWPTLLPPASLLEAGIREGSSEIDVLIECEAFVWIIEAKYKSDISLRTTHHPSRDQIVRNIDVGSEFAGARSFYFSLLILDEARSPEGARRMQGYSQSRTELLTHVEHRQEGLGNLKSVSLLRWAQLAGVLAACAPGAEPSVQERCERALTWLSGKGIAPSLDER